MTDRPMPSDEWFAREEMRIKTVCIEQAAQMLIDMPQLEAVYSRASLAVEIFMAMMVDLTGENVLADDLFLASAAHLAEIADLTALAPEDMAHD